MQVKIIWHSDNTSETIDIEQAAAMVIPPGVHGLTAADVASRWRSIIERLPSDRAAVFGVHPTRGRFEVRAAE